MCVRSIPIVTYTYTRKRKKYLAYLAGAELTRRISTLYMCALTLAGSYREDVLDKKQKTIFLTKKNTLIFFFFHWW